MSKDEEDEFDDNASFASVDDLEGMFLKSAVPRFISLTCPFEFR
jgi:hypothetical protein